MKHVMRKQFIRNITRTLDVIAPKTWKTIPSKWVDKRWYTEEIKVKTSVRDKAFNIAVKSKKKRLGMIQNDQVVKLIRNTKKNYYENMIDANKQGPPKMWKAMKEVINGKTSESKVYNRILFEETEEEDKIEMVNKFNNYFINSISEIIRSIDTSDSEENCNINKI